MEKKNWMIYQSNVQRRIYLDGLLKKTYSAVDRGSFLLNAGAEFPLIPLFKLRLLLLSKSRVHSVLGRCFDHLLGKRGHSQDLHDPSCEYHKCFFSFFFLPPSSPNKSRLNVRGTKAARSNSLLRDKPAVYTALIWDRHGCRDNRLLAASQSLRHFHRFCPG